MSDGHLFYDLLDAAIRDNVPSCLVRPQRFPRWFDEHVTSAYNDKRRAHRKYKRSGAAVNYFEFSSKRRDFKTAADLAYRNHVTKIEIDLNSYPKNLFKFVNSKTQ